MSSTITPFLWYSLSVSGENQDETDRISDALIAGGGAQGPCG